MPSAVETCKLGLSHLGKRYDISALDEGSTESDICQLIYEPTRDATLRAYPWNFAKAYISPPTLSLTTVPGGWTYAYAYPADALKIRHITTLLDTDPPIKFEIAHIDVSGTDTKVLLTNQVDAELVYTKKITDELMFDPQFIMAHSYLIAAQSAMALTGDRNIHADMTNMWRNLTSAAEESDANEGVEDATPLPDWINVRD